MTWYETKWQGMDWDGMKWKEGMNEKVNDMNAWLKEANEVNVMNGINAVINWMNDCMYEGMNDMKLMEWNEKESTEIQWMMEGNEKMNDLGRNGMTWGEMEGSDMKGK